MRKTCSRTCVRRRASDFSAQCSCGEAVITIGELGEFGLIAAIAEVVANVTAASQRTGMAQPILGIGDDAAVLQAPDGRVVVTADMLIERRHFRREWSSATDIGAKAAARNLADVAAMGARPTGLLVCFAGPADLAVDWALDLAAGIAEECAIAGASVAGGDVSSADSIMLALTATGDLAGLRPVTRAGAAPGDVVAIAGRVGAAAAGLDLLASGTVPADSLLSDLIRAHQRPRPPYAAGPKAAAAGASAMIDVSDGLLADLGHVAAASGVRIDIRAAAVLAEPVSPTRALRAAADYLAELRDGGAAAGNVDGPATRTKPLAWVLSGGDDHALAATFPAGTELPGSFTAIGAVTAGTGVTLDGKPAIDQAGWEHFRSNDSDRP